MRTRALSRCLLASLAGLALVAGPLDRAPAWAQGGGANAFQSYARPLPLPDFSLEDLQGKTVQIKEYKGKVILLNFWATW